MVYGCYVRVASCRYIVYEFNWLFAYGRADLGSLQDKHINRNYPNGYNKLFIEMHFFHLNYSIWCSDFKN